MTQPQILELFCGIGGVAAASSNFSVAAAVDISPAALATYSRNWPHPTLNRTIESLPSVFFQAHQSHLWWLSPPCQPFTRRGAHRDLDDARSASLVKIIARIVEFLPPAVALENVPGFLASRAHQLFLSSLTQCGYSVHEHLLCPSQFGLPQRRRRVYLTASRSRLQPLQLPHKPCPPLANFLDPSPAYDLFVDENTLARFASAIDIIHENDPAALASCFGASYGKSPVRAGSYLRTRDGRLRRFSPQEVTRLLGFPAHFTFPPQLSLRQSWRLAGNSLAVPVVAAILATFEL